MSRELIRDVLAKLSRAEQHLRDLKGVLTPFTERRAHPVRKREEPQGKKTKVVWRLEIAGSLDPACNVIAGDMLHNLRGALDYLAYALNPPQNRHKGLYFPLFDYDPWLRDRITGKYLKRDQGSINKRVSFRRVTRDMHPKAQAIIKAAQPCFAEVERGQTHVLLILTRLNNADKSLLP